MSQDERRVVYIEDEEFFADQVRRALAPLGFRVEWHATGEAGLRAIGEGPAPEAVLLDLGLAEGGLQGKDVLRRLAQRERPPPVIVLTGESSYRTMFDLHREAGTGSRTVLRDYLVKGYRGRPGEKVPPRNAFALLALAVERAGMRHAGKPVPPAMVGVTDAILRAYDDVRLAALGGPEHTILVEGETGTGKEVAARLTHHLSGRPGKFVGVNCAAMPENLLESELFGHVKGAFTGATAQKDGLFRAAARGTIFLDEIGDLPATLQAKLLRVLEEREVRRVGEERSDPVDVRVICATNKDLWAEVAAGRFREDLLFRVSTLVVSLPALRQRKQDVAPLLRAMLRDRFEANPWLCDLDPKAEALLERHRFPGNVRELRMIVDRALLVARHHGKDSIDAAVMEEALQARRGGRPGPAGDLAEVARLAVRALGDALFDGLASGGKASSPEDLAAAHPEVDLAFQVLTAAERRLGRKPNGEEARRWFGWQGPRAAETYAQRLRNHRKRAERTGNL